MTEKEELKLKEKIVRAIKTVFDPEIPVDVYELGLIYDIQILPLDNVHILMTLTSPNCPAAETIPADVKNRVEMIKEIIVFDAQKSKQRHTNCMSTSMTFLLAKKVKTSSSTLPTFASVPLLPVCAALHAGQ